MTHVTCIQYSKQLSLKALNSELESAKIHQYLQKQFFFSEMCHASNMVHRIVWWNIMSDLVISSLEVTSLLQAADSLQRKLQNLQSFLKPICTSFIHKSPSLSQKILVHAFTSYFMKIQSVVSLHSYIGLPSSPFPA